MPNDATPETIARAYRARTEALASRQLLNEADEKQAAASALLERAMYVLGDEQRRIAYDMTGEYGYIEDAADAGEETTFAPPGAAAALSFDADESAPAASRASGGLRSIMVCLGFAAVLSALWGIELGNLQLPAVSSGAEPAVRAFVYRFAAMFPWFFILPAGIKLYERLMANLVDIIAGGYIDHVTGITLLAAIVLPMIISFFTADSLPPPYMIWGLAQMIVISFLTLEFDSSVFFFPIAAAMGHFFSIMFLHFVLAIPVPLDFGEIAWWSASVVLYKLTR